MQFREIQRAKSGRAVEFVRWRYDADKGRSVSEVLGRMSVHDSAVPPEVLAKLTEAERADVDAWWATLVEGRRKTNLGYAAKTFPDYARSVVEALAAGVVDAKGATPLWAAVDALTAALKKAGHKRPAKPAQ